MPFPKYRVAGATLLYNKAHREKGNTKYYTLADSLTSLSTIYAFT